MFEYIHRASNLASEYEALLNKRAKMATHYKYQVERYFYSNPTKDTRNSIITMHFEHLEACNNDKLRFLQGLTLDQIMQMKKQKWEKEEKVTTDFTTRVGDLANEYEHLLEGKVKAYNSYIKELTRCAYGSEPSEKLGKHLANLELKYLKASSNPRIRFLQDLTLDQIMQMK